MLFHTLLKTAISGNKYTSQDLKGKFSPLTGINPAYAPDDKNAHCMNYFHVLRTGGQTNGHPFDVALVVAGKMNKEEKMLLYS